MRMDWLTAYCRRRRGLNRFRRPSPDLAKTRPGTYNTPTEFIFRP
jgi:hypothetical protein